MAYLLVFVFFCSSVINLCNPYLPLHIRPEDYMIVEPALDDTHIKEEVESKEKDLIGKKYFWTFWS